MGAQSRQHAFQIERRNRLIGHDHRAFSAKPGQQARGIVEDSRSDTDRIAALTERYVEDADCFSHSFRILLTAEDEWYREPSRMKSATSR